MSRINEETTNHVNSHATLLLSLNYKITDTLECVSFVVHVDTVRDSPYATSQAAIITKVTVATLTVDYSTRLVLLETVKTIIAKNVVSSLLITVSFDSNYNNIEVNVGNGNHTKIGTPPAAVSQCDVRHILYDNTPVVSTSVRNTLNIKDTNTLNVTVKVSRRDVRRVAIENGPNGLLVVIVRQRVSTTLNVITRKHFCLPRLKNVSLNLVGTKFTLYNTL